MLETLGGERPLSESWARSPLVRMLLGLWWAALFALIVFSSGRNFKFIYIDF